MGDKALAGSTAWAHDHECAALAGVVAALDFERIEGDLAAQGWALTSPLLSAAQCGSLVGAYDEPALFRSRIVMARHGFGRGEYQYFTYPLPPLVAALRTAFYPPLAAIANRWSMMLGEPVRYPKTHARYLAECRRGGQVSATPLLLRYRVGDYNCLHQDLYGALHFPLQIAFLLDRPGVDFTGGEFLLTEQRPRMQSRGEVVPLGQGEGVIFAVNRRPVMGSRGPYRVVMRHGVSRLRSGHRHTLGIIFHDAR